MPAPLVPGALWFEMVPALERLPDGPLSQDDLLTEDFKLASEGRLSVYWIPFERLNPEATLVICGLTPGYGQLLEAFTAARDSIAEGQDLDHTIAHVERTGSFAGTMRTNLVQMLDELGLPQAMNIGSTLELFGEANELVHTTSALRYPVFVAGKNYSGGSPEVNRSALLSSYVHELLGPELAAVPGALIIPLGKATEACMRMLVAAGDLDEERCLLGFPHPSGGNGHRIRQFRENEEVLRTGIAEWKASYA